MNRLEKTDKTSGGIWRWIEETRGPEDRSMHACVSHVHPLDMGYSVMSSLP